MKLKPAKLAPALIALIVVAFGCLLRIWHLSYFEHLERTTYDFRVRQALRFSPAVSTNLGFVYIDDASIDFVRTNKSLGYNYGLYWPRQVYGRLVEELSAQGARAIGFDVIFGDRRPDHPPAQMADGRLIESDEFFALQLKRAGNVVLADAKDLTPPDLFTTNAFALGDITTDSSKDRDGVLRRAQAFHIRREWHPVFQMVEVDPEYGVDLKKARVETNQIVLPRDGAEDIKIPLDDQGHFALADFVGDHLPPGTAPTAAPFTEKRIWHMGIVLAAIQLNLDLDRAKVDLENGQIVLPGPDGIQRILPVDRNGYFYVDWSIPHEDPRLFKESIQKLLQEDRWRLDGTNTIPNNWAGKIAIIGSSAIGNDLTDRGATPLDRATLLASEHWNVANSILMNRFVRRTSIPVDLALIAVLGFLVAFITWHLRILIATGLVAAIMAGYFVVAVVIYVQTRYWIPLVLPLFVAGLINYVALLLWRVLVEQAEQRRVRSIFSRIVSPNIVHELLGAEKLSLGGARREVTVLFADVRGFTEFTDTNQERADAFVAEHKLSGAEMEAYYDEQARETLNTVNTYLALVADIVKKHCGTLDKYIGDCVMAFWGAPTPNAAHACDCVHAAIDAQRSLANLNRQRMEENQRREIENTARISAGLPPKLPLPVLTLGSGINTGLVTVGLMGSEDHISNYTVFGREVNLASRIESLSGRGRILITGTTYERLLRDDPELAATCVALPPANVKGIRSAVKIYEVPWQTKELTAPATNAPRGTLDTSLLAAKNESGQ
ncbi:MAG TPA: CHASE2 domain-containing protein [Verrucomicrobiae bacterium]|nr:CHASE2 domain-containing protein [Verrucomicrobiae bacterium]